MSAVVDYLDIQWNFSVQPSCSSWTCSSVPLGPYPGPVPCLTWCWPNAFAPEVKVPPTPTHTSKGRSQCSNGSQPSCSSVQSSGIGQTVAHSLPGMRQPTGTGLSAASASMSQTQLTSGVQLQWHEEPTGQQK